MPIRKEEYKLYARHDDLSVKDMVFRTCGIWKEKFYGGIIVTAVNKNFTMLSEYNNDNEQK